MCDHAGPVGNEKYLSRFYCEEIMNRDFMKIRGNYQQNHFSNIHGSYEPTPSLTKLHCHISTYGKLKKHIYNIFCACQLTLKSFNEYEW